MVPFFFFNSLPYYGFLMEGKVVVARIRVERMEPIQNILSFGAAI